jgi:uncharacterized glyoxalase superfamily protein PhnB
METLDAQPEIDCEHQHPILVVDDILQALQFYKEKLAFKEGFVFGDPVSYAGLAFGQISIHLKQGESSSRRSAINFVVGNADELYDFHKNNGVQIVEDIDDRDYGIRDYTIKDLWGHLFCFGHYIYSHGDKLKIERVEVPVRLEKRLAGLLTDLAKHKRMSINSCLEEILLHTCEPYGDGVASPHTKSTLRYIQELKKKHGIDYDIHASYRFVEE